MTEIPSLFDELRAERDALKAELEIRREQGQIAADRISELMADLSLSRQTMNHYRAANESTESLNTALTARVQALEKMLKKILPEQNPLHAEISCDYCTAFQNIDLDEEDRHDPDCPWLLVYGPDSNSTRALDLSKHNGAVRRDALEQAFVNIKADGNWMKWDEARHVLVGPDHLHAVIFNTQSGIPPSTDTPNQEPKP